MIGARSGQDYTSTPNELELKNAEFLARVLPEYLREAAGLPYKFYNEVRELRDTDLAQLAREISPQKRSVNSSNFATAISDALNSIIKETWPNCDQRLLPFVSDFPVDNFKPQNISMLNFPELSPVVEDGITQFDKIELGATTTAEMRSYETRIKITRQLWSTHGADLTRATLEHTYATATLELRLLSLLLSSNPDLSDGDPLFKETNSTSNALTIATFDSGLGYLAESDLELSGILTGCFGKAIAKEVLVKCGMQSTPVVSSPFLNSSSYYLVADPKRKPSLLRLRERNGNKRPAVNWIRVPHSDLIGYYSAHDVGFAAISRNGIYRGGV
jgi:hypothetical protein